MPVHTSERTEYTFEERVDHLVCALDKIRNLHGLDYGVAEPYSDDEKEDGPGAFVVLVDGPKEVIEDGVYVNRTVLDEYQPLFEKADALGRQLEQDRPSDETYAAFDELLEELEEPAEKPAERLAGTYWDTHNVVPDVGDHDIYRQIFETAEYNDGAIVVGENGFSRYTYEIPQLPFEGEPDGTGTKHKAARGLAETPIYDEAGDEYEVRSIVLSETTGGIKVYAAEGFVRYGLNTEIPYPEDWAQMLPADTFASLPGTPSYDPAEEGGDDTADQPMSDVPADEREALMVDR